MTFAREPRRRSSRPTQAGGLVAALAVVHVAAAAEPEQADWLSFSGELRERFESSDHPLFGLEEPAHNDYLLHRLYLAVDLRPDPHFQARLEAVSASTSGWEGEPPPTQDDPADILQAYVEGSFDTGSGKLQLRAGRGELKLGSSRLVSVRDSTNVRRAFDGLHASFIAGDARMDAFYVRPVLPESGTFDDRSSAAQEFWGLYATMKLPGQSGLAADFYYLGLDRDDAHFASGSEREHRHTVGIHVFGDPQPLHLNLEGALQWGTFGDLVIRAWTLSADVGYSLAAWRGSPRIGLKADVVSGDRDPDDRTLGTFNPLFPRLSYFSDANVATPANLMDIQPNITFTPARNVSATLSWNVLWKYSREDAFYAPPLAPVQGTVNTQSRYIGEQVSALAEWQVNERLSVSATYVYFEPGAFVRQAGGRSGSFGAAWAQFAF